MTELSPFTYEAFKQWLAVLKREGRKETFVGKLRLARHILASAFRIGGVTRQQWLKRMEMCQKCPLHDPSLWRCRPFDNSDLGCGCFTKYISLIKNDGCWGYRNLKGQGIGWGPL